MAHLENFDTRQLRNVLGTFTTGVTVVTTRDQQGKLHGVTANSFSSVSLEPPLVLWSLALTSSSFAAFSESDHFAVNILADDQIALSNHFSRSSEDKFAGVPFVEGLGGAAILEGLVAHLECRKVSAYPAGDHVIYIGQVERISHTDRRPLAFAHGRYMVPHAHEAGPVAQPGIQKQMVITLEEHYVTHESLRLTGEYGSGPEHGPLAPKLLDLGAGRIAAMDEAGIDFQVLSPVATGFEALSTDAGTALARNMNDELAAAIAANPTRLGGFATLGMKDPEDAAAELERCITKLHFAGVIINGTTDGLFLDDPRFMPIFETAQRLDVPIYLHPALPPKTVQKAYFSGLTPAVETLLSIAGWGWHAETGLHTLRLICSGLFEKLPRLQLIIGHMGEGLPYAMARSSGILTGAAGLPKPLADYFKTNISITTSGYFTLPPLVCALEVLGLDRILFSIDYPFSANTKGRDFLTQAATILDEAQMQQFTSGNAKRLLKLPI